MPLRNHLMSYMAIIVPAAMLCFPAAGAEVAASVGLEFVAIPAGSFMMGSDAELAFGDEQPVHRVAVSAFEMSVTEVTQATWLAVMGRSIEEQRDLNHPSRELYGVGPDLPVYYVSWEDCQAFVDILNSMDPVHIYRLPSEAEWEYACKAGTSTVYPWGDRPDVCGDYCWMVDNSGYEMHPVAQKLPNAWGLYDMLGNAIELCEDEYLYDYQNAPVDGSAWVDEGDGFRVSRGGSFDLAPSMCTSSRRFYEIQDERQHYTGFRIVRVPRQEQAASAT